MALDGECVSTGANPPYKEALPQICCSPAGYYVGFLDEDGRPYSRESGYYRDREMLDALWLLGVVSWRGWIELIHPELHGNLEDLCL